MALVKVGTFTKPATAAPFRQVVPGVGFRPKVAIFWSVNAPLNATLVAGLRSTIGFDVDITAEARPISSRAQAIGLGAATGVATTAVASDSRRGRAILAEDPSGSIAFAGFVDEWNTDGFGISWVTNTTGDALIHYLAIGGDDVRAWTVDWLMPVNTEPLQVRGVGFRPSALLHLYGVGVGVANLGILGIGAEDTYGGAWAVSTYSINSRAGAYAERIHAAGVGYARTASPETSRVISTEPDGFTIRVTNPGNNNTFIRTLCLAGVDIRVGSFLKSVAAAPVSQSIVFGFRPKAVLLVSAHVPGVTSTLNARLGIGAAGGGTIAASTYNDRNAANPTEVRAMTFTNRVFAKRAVTAGTPEALADTLTMLQDGFSINWTGNDAIADRLSYLAIGDLDHGLDARIAAASVAQIGYLRESRNLSAVVRAGARIDILGEGRVHPLSARVQVATITQPAPVRIGHKLAAVARAEAQAFGDGRQAQLLAAIVRAASLTNPAPTRVSHKLSALTRAAAVTRPVPNGRVHALAGIVRAETIIESAPVQRSHLLSATVRTAVEAGAFSRLVLPVVRPANRRSA